MLLGLATAAGLALSSCDSLIYDEEGDCAPYYKVRFKYDRNLKFADAFHSEVHEVTLYVIDLESGKIVWQRHADGPELREEGYLMDVDVAPGTYKLIAWCGEGHRTSFAIPEAEHHTGLQCSLTDRKGHPEHGIFPEKTGSAVPNRLGNLYHGMLESVEFPATQGVHQFTISLTKDTNTVSIGLGHLSQEPVEGSFIYTLEEANGKMDHDNSIMDDEPLTYFAFDQYQAPIEWETVDSKGRAATAVTAGAWGHLTTGRLMADRKAMVKVYNADKELIASINLTSVAKHLGYIYDLDEQDYLDYCDAYNVTFLLDENNRWVNSTIYINSWKIVLQDSDL